MIKNSVRLQPSNSMFLSHQISTIHQYQPDSSTFLSQQISTSHQPQPTKQSESCFDESCYLYSQRTLETALFCQYHGIPETAHQNTTTQSTPGRKLAVQETQASDILGSKRWLAILFIKHRGSLSCHYSYLYVLKFIQIIDHTDCCTGYIRQERGVWGQYV